MTFGIAALISWLVTAALGTVLLSLWVARGLRRRGADVRASYNRPPPYIPRLLLAAHVLLAAAGLAMWAAYLLLDVDMLAYLALGALIVVTLLGSGMFVRWIGSRRARRAARAGAGAPAESRLPVLVVLCHGVMGVATLLLVALVWIRPGGL
ncbi:MAG TPA: hypothetical protein VGO86_03060 [Candidatus Dormibacteraeota bacterium]|jgi:hypothetical protein